MRIKIEYEYDPLQHYLFPYFAKVGDEYFNGKTFDDAKTKALEHFKKVNLAVKIPPPEEIEICDKGKRCKCGKVKLTKGY